MGRGGVRAARLRVVQMWFRRHLTLPHTYICTQKFRYGNWQLSTPALTGTGSGEDAMRLLAKQRVLAIV